MVKCGSELMVSIEIVHLAFRLIEIVLALEEQVLFIRNQKFFSSHVKSWVVRNKTKFVSFIFGGAFGFTLFLYNNERVLLYANIFSLMFCSSFSS